jgi:SAM-dependent methyltransferase
MSAGPPCGPGELLAEFGRIDIYVFDQLMRGRITPSMRVLDAGCGAGRNSEYLMRCGADIYAVDANPDQIARVRDLASRAAPTLPEDHFRVARLNDLPFPADHFDAVICNAVLHFSEDTAAFEDAVSEMWRVLRPGGVFFVRLASTIGIERAATHLRDRWYRLPDGTDRFLVDEKYLLAMSSELEASQLDPLKTTVVQDMRSMTTWVLGKPPR